MTDVCMENSGMIVKQYVSENDTEYLVIKHKIGNIADEEQYRKYFNKLKEEGILINDTYDDQKWICYTDSDTAIKTLSFPFELRSDINIAVKNYILIKIYVQKSSLTTVIKRLSHIRHFMIDTGFMNADNVKDYQDTLCTWNDNKKREAISVREFLIYSNLENAELYYNVLKNIRKMENGFRELPDFKAILTFDYIVNEYWNEIQYSDNKYRLFPIVLWWKLTTVIPIRPCEFFNLKRDCVYAKNGRYYFKIIRKKTILDKELIISDVITDFELNEELYFLIHDYVEYCNKIDNCKYLISPPTSDVIYRNKVLNTREKFTNEKMNNYYKVFQKEIVEGQYHYKVVKSHNIKEGELPHIYYGDTRHLAILNMMQMGVNPIYIAQLSGHHTLDAQMGYYSHLESFTTAKTYMLCQFMKQNVYTSQNGLKDDATKTSNLIKRDKMGYDYYSLPKVAGGQGRCSSKNIPFECNHTSCLLCKYFFPENVTEDYVEYLKEENENAINIITKELKVLLGQTVLRDNKAIEQNALRFGVLLNQKVIIDSYTYKKDKD